MRGINGNRPQRLMALELANDVRRQRAEVRRALADGSLPAPAALVRAKL